MKSIGSKPEEMKKDSTLLQLTVMTEILQMEMAAKDDAAIVSHEFSTPMLEAENL